MSKLKSINYDVWFDNKQLRAGDSLTLEIEKRNIISASFDKTIKIWNFDTRKCVETLIFRF